MQPGTRVKITLRDRLMFKHTYQESAKKPTTALKTVARTAKKLLNMPTSASPKSIYHYDASLKNSIYNGTSFYGVVRSIIPPSFLPIPPSEPESSILTNDKTYTTLQLTNIPKPDETPMPSGSMVYLTDLVVVNQGAKETRTILVYKDNANNYSIYTVELTVFGEELKMPPLMRRPPQPSTSTSARKSIRSQLRNIMKDLPPLEKPIQNAGAELNALTVKELQAKCAKRKIKYSGLRKAELVAALKK
jgi:hypothetical protein